MDATDRAGTGERAAPRAAVRSRPARMSGLLMACHPLPAVAVTVLAAGLGVAAGQDASGCVLLTVAVLAGQLSVGWSNDAIDAVRDATVGRTGKPVAGGAVSASAVGAAAVSALVVCVPLSLLYGVLAGTVHLLGVAAAWLYNVRLKSTLLSWLPYAIGFAALPAFVTLGLPGGPWPAWWAVTAGALLGVGAHLANVLPDIPADLATGVRGWPQRLGPAAVRLLLPVPLVAATAVLVAGRPSPAGAAVAVFALTAAVGGSLLGRHRPRLPFLAAIVVAALDVALLLGHGAALA